MYIAYNMCCLAIYLMPIPLTPPDDEAGISIPNSSIIYKGLLIYNIIIVAQPAFVKFSTMSTYDYVYLIIKAMSSMTLLSQYLHIHFQFKFILFIFLQFNIL